MAELPRGTVTFLFTDIEGSTRLLQELGDHYSEALAEHRRLLRKAFARHGGVEVDTQGDAFFVAFPSARDAVAAASEGQAGLCGRPIRVRMGLHTGEAQVTEEGYVGLDVHRAARIAAAGHGGQVLISRSTRDLVEAGVRDLGEHRLKDLAAPERFYQLGAEEFPPLKSLSNTNLPIPATPLVGRERELAKALELLASARLLTLTGAGGSGKTRLALQGAAELVEEFEDGVVWVPLAALSDAELVLPTIAAAVGAKDDLAQFVDDKRMLLLLDNLEQILGCGPALVELLSACPSLKLLVTSRAPLRVSGEQEYEVPPLAEGEAVELFTQRARQVNASFEPDEHVPEICRRLDALPLALELAAARIKLLSPAELLVRLGQSLDVLATGSRDLPERQRTLRTTIEWSYGLLAPQEQELFARLAVFAGGCTLAAGDEICHAELDALASLVDKSLLRHTGERFWMLETIREFAVERLEESDEADRLRLRHASYFCDLAEAEAQKSEESEAGFLGLSEEHANLRAALAASFDAEDWKTAARLCIALAPLWEAQGRIVEGRLWFDRALAAKDDVPIPLRTRLLDEAGFLDSLADESDRAVALLEESLELGRAIGDHSQVARTLRDLGAALPPTNPERAVEHLGEALRLARHAGDRERERSVLHMLGEIIRDLGDLPRAAELLQSSISLARKLGNLFSLSYTLHSLGDLELDRAQFDRARDLYRESLGIASDLDIERVATYCLAGMAAIAARCGDLATAAYYWGPVEAFERKIGLPLLSYERERYERAIGPVVHRADPEPSFAEAVARALALD